MNAQRDGLINVWNDRWIDGLIVAGWLAGWMDKNEWNQGE